MKKRICGFLCGLVSMTVYAADAVMIPVMNQKPEIFSAEFLRIRGIGRQELLKLMEGKKKLVPENRRKACMESLRQHVETFAPDRFEEFSGMDRAPELFPSFSTFEIDMEFPELTTFFLASGPPRNMTAIPIPVGAFALPEDMVSGKWTATGFAFKQKAGMDHTKREEPAAVENKLCSEYRIVREQARSLLRKGKRAEASGLLRNT